MEKSELDRAVYEFICQHLQEQGRPPTRREVTQRMQTNPNQIAGSIYRLRGAGKLLEDSLRPVSLEAISG